jgi:hypothetical protein
MMKFTTFPLVLIAFLLISSIILSGCTASNTSSITNNSSRQHQWQNRTMTNLTEEQRQQMINERQQLAISACQNKMENDSCVMQGQRGNFTGTCKIQENLLICISAMNGRQTPRNQSIS